MKSLLILLFISKCFFAVGQSPQSRAKKSISPTTAAKVGVVKKFVPVQLFFVMLTKGYNRNHDSLAAARIQEGHIANIDRLAGLGKILVAGPFMDDANWRGIFIMKCKSQQEVENLLQTDPAIAAGRLSYEIHPWMTGKNCLFN